MTVLRSSPPDGGWGWAVVVGAVIINMTGRSLEPSFGLLFGDLLKELKVETTGAAAILSTMDAVINFSGLLVGPLIKRLTYRKVAITGCLLSCLGLLTTSMANSVSHIIITYSIIGGVGIGLMIASTFVGIHLYFDKNKGQAVGLAMAGTAFGYMAMPQIVSFLILHYNFLESMIILSAIALHAVIGASLFQPVKWHLKHTEVPLIKEEIIQIPEENEEEELKELDDQVGRSLLDVKKPNGIERCVSLECDSSSVQRKCSVPIGSNRKISIISGVPKVKSLSDCTQHSSTTNRNLPKVSSATILRKSSLVSTVSNVDFIGSAMHIAYDTDDDRGLEINFTKKKERNSTKKKESIQSTSTCCKSFLKIMGFDLLSDMVYVNILFGIALIFVADLHFRMIMPFYMMDMEYTKQEVAMILSSMAIADILSRLIMPLMLDRLSCSRRATLLVCCLLVAASRSILALQTTMTPFIIVAVVNGFIRGMTLINIPLVLSEYATKDNFPSVLGLSMVARGIFIVILGPLGGYIRDSTNSYPICIHLQSVVSLLCALVWIIEYLFRKKFR